MIWGGGLLAQMGVLDFAGGIVVHATAGFAALASVFYVGSRRYRDSKPNNIPLMAIGTALLWFGWYGFNAGSELSVNGITALAFMNTDVAASFAAITWMVIEWYREEKPKFVGLMTGAVAGLATVTPAAGFISIPVAAFMGILGAIVCYGAVHIKNRMEWDDALDVWGVHGVGGLTGTILLGVFASTLMNPAGADGLLYGGTAFFIKQVLVVAIASVYAFIFTYIMLMFINVITPVKVTDEDQLIGLDISLHGESAYDSILR
jgi:Amt family ammonium transporter